jgi:hypothetical protein
VAQRTGFRRRPDGIERRAPASSEAREAEVLEFGRVFGEHSVERDRASC